MTWKHLVRSERALPPLLVAEMFCVRLEEGDYGAAISCLSNFAFVESHVFSRKTWSKILVENVNRIEEVRLDELVREASVVLAGSENAAIRNMVESCKEVLRSGRISSTDVRQINVGSRYRNEAASLVF